MARIDLEGMDRLVRGMEDVTTYLPGIRNEFNKTLHRFSIGVWSTAPLADVAAWAGEELPGLRRRLALARQIEERSPSWAAGVVQIDESRISTTDPALARRQGADTALALLRGRGVPDGDLLRLLDEMQDDPYFAAGFARAVTPEQLAQIVTRLSGTRRPLDGTQTYAENEKSNAWYDRLLGSVATTLGTATYSTGDLALPPDYASTWVQAITADVPTDVFGDGTGRALPDQAAALGLLLGSGGRFEGEFVTTVAEGVYDYERAYEAAYGSKVWYPRTSGAATVGAGIFDPATGGVYVDPLVGIMAALSTNAVAAQDFFSRGGTTTIDVDGTEVTVGQRLQYLLVERTWSAHATDGVTLGLALEAATTTFRDRGDRGATSARIAGESFALIGAQTGQGADDWRGDQGWQLWEGMREPVAQMLASYGADVFRVAADDGRDELSDGVYGPGSGEMFPDQMPYGVRLDTGHLAALVATLGEDPDDFTPFLAGVFQAENLAVATGLDRATAQQHGISAAAQFWSNARLDSLSPAITRSSEVTAWVLDHGLGGAQADEAAQAKRAELVADALSLVSELPFVPEISNEWADLAVGQAKDRALDAIKETPSDATSEFRDYDKDARLALRNTTLDLLLRAGYLDASVADEVSRTGQGLEVEPPPREAIRWDDAGEAVGFDFGSDAFREWYRRTAVASIVTESVINTYASAWGSVR